MSHKKWVNEAMARVYKDFAANSFQFGRCHWKMAQTVLFCSECLAILVSASLDRFSATHLSNLNGSDNMARSVTVLT